MRLVVEVQYALGWTDYEFALSLGVHDVSDFDHVADVDDAAHVAVKDGPKLFGADQEQNTFRAFAIVFNYWKNCWPESPRKECQTLHVFAVIQDDQNTIERLLFGEALKEFRGGAEFLAEVRFRSYGRTWLSEETSFGTPQLLPSISFRRLRQDGGA
jgi:hypothetical protein